MRKENNSRDGVSRKEQTDMKTKLNEMQAKFDTMSSVQSTIETKVNKIESTIETKFKMLEQLILSSIPQKSNSSET
jgi:hypothetical protein